ncbi:membrane protein [Clostridia bacterium]|nr:membrane protein [Clostridia bacterium]
MTSLLILADDITGALDTAVQMTRQDISTVVFTSPDAQWKSCGKTCVVISTQTRHLPPDQAADIVMRLAQTARQARIPFIYKKTDSALRGNIGAELQALLDVFEGQNVCFAPAFPDMGRITKDGIHYIDGIPVAQSVFASDPFTPVLHSRVIDQLRTSGLKTSSVRVFDAGCNEDFFNIPLAEFGAEPLLLAGCAGFARVLPGLIKRPRNLLALLGSLNPITIKQAEYAARHGFVHINIDDAYLFSNSDDVISELMDKLIRDVEAHSGHDIVLMPRVKTDNPSDINASQREMVADRLGILAAGLAARDQHTLLLCGGDVLLASLKRMGVNELTPRKELMPGVVLAKTSVIGNSVARNSSDRNSMNGNNTEGTSIITKSGGFGSESLLCDLAALLSDKAVS